MTKADLKKSALQLPAEDRRDLAVALWRSLETDPGELPDWQRRLLKERLIECADEEGQPWNKVKPELWPDRG